MQCLKKGALCLGRGGQFAAQRGDSLPTASRCAKIRKRLKIGLQKRGAEIAFHLFARWGECLEIFHDQADDHKQILVIEDDDSIREALEELFVSEGYSVAMAENGSTGMEVFAKTKPQLVLLDLMMPVMDGRGFLRAMSEVQDRRLADTPIVLITAAGEKGATGCQVSEVLTKPIDIAKLLDVAQKYCH